MSYAMLVLVLTMARLLTCGFELAGPIAAQPTGYEINGVSATTALAIQNAFARSGSYALRAGGSTAFTTGQQAYVDLRPVAAATAGPLFARFYLYIVTPPTAENVIARLVGGSIGCSVTISSDGASGCNIFLYETTNISIGSDAIPMNQWVRVELKYDASGAGANDTIIQLYLNGTLAVGTTGAATSNTILNLRIGGNIASEANTVGEWYFDDVAINDSAAGGSQTGLPGDGSLIYVWPNGDGDADTTVTRSSGATVPTGTDRGANWQQLGNAFDKPSPNDGTDFLLLTSNSSEVLVACEDISIHPLSTITLVHVGGRIATAVAGTGNWIPEIMSQSAGTKLAGTTVTIAVTTWGTNDDTTSSTQFKLTSYTDPQAGGAWTQALINSMQIGAKTSDGNPDTIVSALWAVIEYVPAPTSLPVISQTRVRDIRKVAA